VDLFLGILLLLTYFGMIYFAVKGGNLMIGFFVMAILWVIIGGVHWSDAIQIFETGPEGYAITAVVVIFGSWFGRVIVDTGIAGSIIRKVVELGGEKPLVITILLSIVTSLIFTSTFGVGAVIAIGVIILPILLSLGVPKHVAISSFTLSVGAGMYVNVVLFKQIQLFFPTIKYGSSWLHFGFIAMGLQILVIILMLIFNLRSSKLKHAWATPQDTSPKENAPLISFIVPIVPVFMAIAFGWQPLPAIMLAIILALLLTKKLFNVKEAMSIIQKTLHDGVTDVALLLGMLFMLAIFGKAAGLDAHIFKSLIGPLIPHNPWVIGIAIGVLAPLALFRGPLMVWGAGSATIAILAGLGIFQPVLLLPLVYIPTISMAISADATQSWNLWAINYSKVGVKEFLKTGVPWAWAVVIINEIIAVYMFS
jgi:H+/gluconate symporter-like permease